MMWDGNLTTCFKWDGNKLYGPDIAAIDTLVSETRATRALSTHFRWSNARD